jgi:phosphodiesterase/alkaline phosphatase D-like protein
LVAALSVFVAAQGNTAPAQGNKAPLVYDKPGDRDDTVTITEGPRVIDVTPISVTIEWKTNKNAANHIRYGTDNNHPDKSKYVPGGSREHKLQLTGLEPGKTYFFHIMERDSEVRQGGSGTFSTAPAAARK